MSELDLFLGRGVKIKDYLAAQTMPIPYRTAKFYFYSMCAPPIDFDRIFDGLCSLGLVDRAILTVKGEPELVIALPTVMDNFRAQINAQALKNEISRESV